MKIKINTNPELINLMKKMPSLMFGLLLYSLGILATLYSNLGMSPWDVFHMGIINYVPFTLGQISQITGLVVLIICYFMGTIPGLASVFNMIFIGMFIDLIQKLNIFKHPTGLVGEISMLFFGIFIMGWATYFYLRVNLGAGPRDGLMEVLVKKSNMPVWFIRSIIEGSVLIIGYFLGGPVGLGTLLTACSIGLFVQLAFRIGNYSSKDAKHVNLIELYKSLRTAYVNN